MRPAVPYATPPSDASPPPRIVVHDAGFDPAEALRTIARVETLRTRIRHAASNPAKGIEITERWGAVHGQHRVAILSATTSIDALLHRMSDLAYGIRRLLISRGGSGSTMEDDPHAHTRHDPRRSIDIALAVRPGCFEIRDEMQHPGIHVVLSGTPIDPGDAAEEIDAAGTILDQLVEDLRTIAEGRSVPYEEAIVALRISAEAIGRHAGVEPSHGIVAHFARDDQPTTARFVGTGLSGHLVDAPSDPLVAHGVRFVLIGSREPDTIEIGSVGTVESREMDIMEALRAVPIHRRIVDLARSIGCIPS